jgi:hypothetical protein
MVVWPLHGAANERRIVQEKGTGTKRNEKISPVDLGTASDRPVTTTDPDPPVCVDAVHTYCVAASAGTHAPDRGRDDDGWHSIG